MSYFGDGRIRGNEMADNRRQVHGPERALRLAIVYLDRAVERRIDVEIAQLPVTSQIKMQPQDLRGRRIPGANETQSIF